MKRVFEVHQRITFMVNEYEILKDAPEGQVLAGFARQKRLAIREHFTLYKDRAQTKVLAKSKARSAIDLGAVYDVFDGEDKALAVFKKDFKKSLLISSWSIYDSKADKLLFKLQEKNVAVAIMRRLWNFIPFAGELPFPIKFHFVILASGKPVGEYNKLTYLRDHYALYLKDKDSQKLDERAWMIMAVLLDAMQSR